MRDLTGFSNHTVACFENDYNNMVAFNDLLSQASRHQYGKYTKEEADTIIRNQFDKVTGINFKTATPMKRRQAWRDHSRDIFTLVEDVLLDRMISGIPSDAFFTNFVREVNTSDGDQNSFYVEDPSLLQVSVYAGNHHDIVRQRVLPGKTFSIETSWYVIKVYTDYELFMLGKVSFSDLIDRCYRSIEQFRLSALYTAFMSMDQSLPPDLKSNVTLAAATKDDVIDMCEAVKAVTGKDVLIVGTRTAVQKLQNTVDYNIWSDAMKQEKHEKGLLGMWEGYPTLALSRINKQGTRDSIFSVNDNKKLFILPVDPDFKPIIRVNEGDLAIMERGMDGTLQDMTVEAEIWYKEGIGVVINQLFGLITITN